MKLLSVAASYPERVVSNSNIVDLVLEQSEKCFEGNLDRLAAYVTECLDFCGSSQRRWCEKGELAIDHIQHAVDLALAESGVIKKDIDLLIYAGVDRGVVEPGDSYFIAKMLGFNNVQAFDILDACNSWIRAADVTNALIKQNSVNTALIVNAEFPMRPGGAIFPDLFKVRRTRDLIHRFPGYTIGEAATASILTADSTNEWDFRYRSRPDLADECTVPLESFEQRYGTWDKVGVNGSGKFASYGRNLFDNVWHEMSCLFSTLDKSELESVRVFLPHSASHMLSVETAKRLNIEDRLFSVFPDYGNVISASIPVGITEAKKAGLAGDSDKIMCCVGSAGMSFSLLQMKL